MYWAGLRIMLNKEICKKCCVGYCNSSSSGLSEVMQRWMINRFDELIKEGTVRCLYNRPRADGIDGSDDLQLEDNPPLPCPYYLEQLIVKEV